MGLAYLFTYFQNWETRELVFYYYITIILYNMIYFLGDSATCKTIDGRNPYGKKTTDYVKIRTTEVQEIKAILVK